MDAHQELCSEKEVQCPHCKDHIIRRLLNQHYNSICQDIQIKCKDCQGIIKRREQDSHAKSCIYRLIQCPDCDIKYRFHEQSAHNCIRELKNIINKQGESIHNMEIQQQKMQDEFLSQIKNIQSGFEKLAKSSELLEFQQNGLSSSYSQALNLVRKASDVVKSPVQPKVKEASLSEVFAKSA